MELGTVLELVKAGFIKDEILQMDAQSSPSPNPEPIQRTNDLPVPEVQPISTPTQAVEPAAVAVPQPVPQPVPVPQPAQQPSPAQPLAENQPSMSDIMQSIAKLTSAVQANAIAQSVIPAGLSNPPSAEDMIAEIIRPTYKERG